MKSKLVEKAKAFFHKSHYINDIWLDKDNRLHIDVDKYPQYDRNRATLPQIKYLSVLVKCESESNLQQMGKKTATHLIQFARLYANNNHICVTVV